MRQRPCNAAGSDPAQNAGPGREDAGIFYILYFILIYFIFYILFFIFLIYCHLGLISTGLRGGPRANVTNRVPSSVYVCCDCVLAALCCACNQRCALLGTFSFLIMRFFGGGFWGFFGGVFFLVLARRHVIHDVAAKFLYDSNLQGCERDGGAAEARGVPDLPDMPAPYLPRPGCKRGAAHPAGRQLRRRAIRRRGSFEIFVVVFLWFLWYRGSSCHRLEPRRSLPLFPPLVLVELHLAPTG